MSHPNSEPTTDDWMPIPRLIQQNCPDGLQCLSTLDELNVKQKQNFVHALIGSKKDYKYTIKNNIGQNVFYAVNCFKRDHSDIVPPYEMKILDNFQNEIIHLSRELNCVSCCLPCCTQKIEVYSPPGRFVGVVEQDRTMLTPKFTIRNADYEEVLIIKGPICKLSDAKFKILSKDKNYEVGLISKQYSGFLRETFTDADSFCITFPMDLDVRMKAVMLGACFLIDFMYFERMS